MASRELQGRGHHDHIALCHYPPSNRGNGLSKHHNIVQPLAPGEFGAIQLVPALGVVAGVNGEGISTQHHAGTGVLDWSGREGGC